VLTGTNLCAWGAPNTTKPEDSRFAELLEALLVQTTIPRIRISSIGPEYINDNIIALLSNPRIHRYLHFSIQSGSSKILRRMGRHYHRDYLDALLPKIEKAFGDEILPNFGADIIV